MAAARKSTPVMRARAITTFALAIGLVPAPHTPFNPLQRRYIRQHHHLVSAATTSSSSVAAATPTTTDDYCDGTDATEACFADAECSACFAGWGAATSSAVSACEQQFPDAAVGTVCEQQGAAFCCNLGDQSTADACMSNGLFARFFGCFMEDFQCTIEEMPCYDASAVSSDVDPSTTPTSTPVPTPGTPPTDALLAPTASPTTTTPDAERSLDVTAAPSSSDSSSGNATEMPSALSEACAGVAAACDAEDDCREGCYAGVVEAVVETSSSTGDGANSYSQCQLRYLLEEGSSSVGSASNVCDVVGSSFCCSDGGEEGEDEGEDESSITAAAETTTVDCVDNQLSRDFWTCALQLYECSIEDTACISGGGGDGSFVTSDDASYSSTPLVEISSDGEGGASSVSGAMGLMERGGKGIELSSGLWVVLYFCLNLVLGLVATDA